MKYVKVAIDQKSSSTDFLYTYLAGDNDIKLGDKVEINFGNGNRKMAAYVMELSDTLSAVEEKFELKSISEVDEKVSLSDELTELCFWMKEVYLCKYMEAIACMVPASMKRARIQKELDEEEQKKKQKVISSIELNSEQKNAVEIIKKQISVSKAKTFLLHGVTGSGKTEVYLNTISEVLNSGRTAIVLVPEISLTIQTISRFRARFGDEVAVLHSKLSKGEKYDEWIKLKTGEKKVAIGVRSAIFAPLSNIGAIIIDEEHESTYKSELSPKYDTITIAHKRAKYNNSVLIMGSATPSVVTYFRAERGRYKLLELKERYNKNLMPKMEIVDMRDELKSGNKSIISINMYNKIKECLEQNEKVILFLNKRGYASFISCRNCGYVVKCDDCNISMTYYKSKNRLTCHFCGKNKEVPKVCPECQSQYVKLFGTGTEKAEEVIRQLFPDEKIDRLDFDTARKKGSLEKILGDFKAGRTNILIGTQIVAKGLDFKDVGLVGIIAADLSLNIPDFRSSERTFQLITQAAGRAGRGNKQGHVIVQSYMPESRAIQCAIDEDYIGMYTFEKEIREFANYPPFCDIILITLIGIELEMVEKLMESAVIEIIKKIGGNINDKILGPKPAYMSKIKENYRMQLIIKANAKDTLGYIKVLGEIKKRIEVKKYIFSVDINPYNMV